MVERDLGSTFLMPQTHLYQPDRVGINITTLDKYQFERSKEHYSNVA